MQPEAMRAPDLRRATIAVAAWTFMVGALALNTHLVGVFYDDGLYAGTAIALSRGAGFVHPHLPGTPAVVHYPPLYPLVLAPLFGTLSIDTAASAAKIANILFAVGSASLIAWHAMRTNLLGETAPTWLAPVIVAASASAVPVLGLQAVLFSEPLFALLLAVAIVLTDVPSPRFPPVVSAALAGAAAASAFLTRSVGVAAGVGIPAYLLLFRRASWRTMLAFVAPVLVVGAAWGLWVAAHADGIDPALRLNYGSYYEVLKQSGLDALALSLVNLLRPLGELTLLLLRGGTWGEQASYYLLGGAALAVGLYGLGHIVQRSAIGLTLVLYFALLAQWPYPPDRFVWCVLPWLALIWARGAVELWAARPPLRLPLVVLLLVMGVNFAVLQFKGIGRSGWWITAEGISANFREVMPWLDQNLPEGSVIATEDEALVWLYTQRPCVPFYVYGFQAGTVVHPTPADHRAYLKRQGVTHVFLSGAKSGSAPLLHALIDSYPESLTAIKHWSEGRVLFRVNP
jgi:hypothetical protein